MGGLRLNECTGQEGYFTPAWLLGAGWDIIEPSRILDFFNKTWTLLKALASIGNSSGLLIVKRSCTSFIETLSLDYHTDPTDPKLDLSDQRAFMRPRGTYSAAI
jgi:hypothetical protein